MTNRFMMSAAAVALIAGAGFANAQGTGKDREQPSAGSTVQQSAPSSERGNSAAEKSPSSGMKATQSEEKKGPPSGMKATQSEEKKSPSSGMKATQSQSGTSVQSQTTGQAGAAAKLSTEQRTQITTVIRDQHVAPVTNVNFSISVGTRVPRNVSFHTLPERVVVIYPEWRGFKFIIVREQILIIDPNTFEIVAILEV